MNTPEQAAPNFWSESFLRQHIRKTLDFYAPVATDPTGGFFHFFKDDGRVYERAQRHLVSSCRFVFNHAMAWREFGDPRDQSLAEHGLKYLQQAHQRPDGGYVWLLDHASGQAIDPTNHCYGLAFVLLAHAHAAMAGVSSAYAGIAQTFELMESRFWEAEHGLYADEADAAWRISPYRGQNANMHSCEALLAAHEATGERQYLERALLIARNICERQAQRCGGLLWEHFDPSWQPDWEYNRDDPTHLFRPWSVQVGHLTEWAKLLLILNRVQPQSWLVPKATELFDSAFEPGWDQTNGGLVYGLDPEGRVCDPMKYFWVQAESLAAAAMLFMQTQEPRFHDAYERIWAYSWQHFVDHQYGAWYRILAPDNTKISDEKSPAGKTDYHTMGACHDVLRTLREARKDPLRPNLLASNP